MKTLLYVWLKKNRVMLINAGSLVGTTIATGGFGFAYWLIAARLYSPQAVGLASAGVSAMTLLGAVFMLGLGTLLIGELPRHRGQEASLISAALTFVCGAGACGGIVFALVAPLVSASFLPFRANIGVILLFGAGVGLTATISVLDSALVGLLRGSLQFWRNVLFAFAKLGILILASFTLVKAGTIIYGTWVFGIVLSLVPLAVMVAFRFRRSAKSLLPNWGLLSRLRTTALEHHALNLILQFPATTLPVLVTIVLSATTNGWFYVAWMISGLVFIASYALTTVLFAVNAGQTHELMQKIRLTLGLAFATCIVANCVLLFGASEILGIFGHTYAVQASTCLRILGFGALPLIIVDHYMAVSRIHRKITRTALPIAAIGCVLQLGLATYGAHVGGLVGLSLGWDTALFAQATIMFPTVFKAAFPGKGVVARGEVFERNTSPMPKLSIFEADTLLLPRLSIFEEETALLPIVNRLDEDTIPIMRVIRPMDNFVLVSNARCPQCNVPLPPYAHFCGICGRKIVKKEAVKVS